MVDMFKDEETEQFFQLVHMFQRSALLHMGMIPDQEGNMMFNLGEAKAGIDLLRMLGATKDSHEETRTGCLGRECELTETN